MDKKFILSIILLSILSCNNNASDPQCACSEQRYERNVVGKIGTTSIPYEIISTSEWKSVGNPKNVGSSDCSNIETTRDGNSYNVHVIQGTENVSKIEVQYRITCK